MRRPGVVVVGMVQQAAPSSLFRRLWCGILGHVDILHLESTRISLTCAECGRETPGWGLQ